MSTTPLSLPARLEPPCDTMPGSVDATSLVDRAVALARQIVADSEVALTWRERRRRRQLARVVGDGAATAFTVELTDAVLRVDDPARAAELLAALVARHGVPSSLARFDRLALRSGAWLAPRWPRLVMPLVRARVRAESASMVLAAEPRPLTRFIARRARSGLDLNLNVLGEAILGEREAERRLADVVATLTRPDVSYVSVKVSSIASQLSSIAFDDGVERICTRLRVLYEAAASCRPARFVNLDMEEFKDLELTIAAFTRLLDEPALLGLEAGIVLQAYLPDSHAALERLTAWAASRRGRGGAAIKVRLVKGANLAMEQVDAEVHGWAPAPYSTKADVDASFKRMVDWCLRPEHVDAVRVGIASHNVFDIAWALTLADERGVADRVEIEMLEGMAPAEARVVRRRAGSLLLYAPITRRRDFTNAVAYLVRRLDENAQPGNYLRAAFSITPGSAELDAQEALFRAAVARAATVSTQTHRSGVPHPGAPGAFGNEPDADFTVAAVRDEALAALARWRTATIPPIPLVIDGSQIHDGGAIGTGVSPNEPTVGRYTYVLASADDVDRAVAVAVAATAEWGAVPVGERRRVLDAAAEVMRAQRFDTLGCLALDGGKTAAEGDAEVSEAIDFARFYGRSAEQLTTDLGTTVTGEPLGPVVVTPPWNFPYAIPAGGVLGALAAGNAVILKPAPEVVLTGWHLASQLWAAGVSRRVLQFVPCPDDEIGRRLVTHPAVGAVILTGSIETADRFRSWRPGLHLLAETSGKNAMVITAAADVDLAVRDLVRSAFGHAGQKCSAASLAIVEAEIYDSPTFRRQLRDAVESLVCGPSWDPATAVPPLIGPPSDKLQRALTSLDPGEEWLVEPVQDRVNQWLWSPGVKLGVAAGSFFHRTECFGPVLGLLRAPDLDTAIAWQNDVEFGLTGGICSLDPSEITTWCERVEVGNAYVNRPITGAVVQRQPFGGWKASAVGPGAKAGGPNYVAGLQRWSVGDAGAWDPAARDQSLDEWWAALAATGHDPSALRSERNVLRHRPLGGGVVLVSLAGAREGTARAIDAACAAARRAGAPVAVADSASPGALEAARTSLGTVVAKLRVIDVDKTIPGERDADVNATFAALESVAARWGAALDLAPVVPHGRLELLRWTREQAVSVTAHRYGNVGAAPVPDLGRWT